LAVTPQRIRLALGRSAPARPVNDFETEQRPKPVRDQYRACLNGAAPVALTDQLRSPCALDRVVSLGLEAVSGSA